VAGVAAPDCGSFLPPRKPRDQLPSSFPALRWPRERRPQIQSAMPAIRRITAAPIAMPAIAPGARPEWPPVALTADDVAAGVGVTVTVGVDVELVAPYSPYSSSWPSSWSSPSSAGSGPSVGHLSPTGH